MTRRSRTAAVAGAALAAAAALFVLAGGAAEEASTAARTGRGLLLARRYLERTGTPCLSLVGERTPEGAGASTVVVAFPASVSRPRRWRVALRRWLHDGGTLVLAYDAASAGSPAEADLLAAFGVATRPLPGIETLNPVRWWQEAAAPALLRGPDLPRPVAVTRPLRALDPAAGDSVLLAAEGGEVLALSRRVGAGLLVVLPSEALANQRLLEAGNADLLERLRARLPTPFAFDEAIHGLGPPVAAEASGTPMADVLLAQVALVYLLAVWALARRMGPAWPEPRPAGASAAALLVRLGAVHRRLGHHRDAALAAVARAAELAGREPPQALVRLAAECDGDGALVELGRRLAAWQRAAGRERR